MNGLSIHFGFPEVTTYLSTLFLLGRSHTTVVSLPGGGAVCLSEGLCPPAWGLILTLCFPACKPVFEGASSHYQPQILKTLPKVLLALFPSSGMFTNIFLTSYYESKLFS